VLAVVDRCGRCSLDGSRRDFAHHTDLDMWAAVVEREQAHVAQDVSAAMVGLNSRESFQMEERQAESIAVA